MCDAGPDLLYIPQDFNEEAEESVFDENYPRTEEEAGNLSEGFLALPECAIGNDDDDDEAVIIVDDSSEEWWQENP